jgi:hypothetical protein
VLLKLGIFGALKCVQVILPTVRSERKETVPVVGDVN